MLYRPESVFVDESGWRRRLFRSAGVAVALLLAGFLALVGVSLFVGAEALPSVPGEGKAAKGKAGKDTGARPGHGRDDTRPSTARAGASPSTSAKPRRTPTPTTAARTPTATPKVPPGRTKSPRRP